MSGGRVAPAASSGYVQIALSFARDGYVVVEDILSPQQLAVVRREDERSCFTSLLFACTKKNKINVGVLLLRQAQTDANTKCAYVRV